mmetsp:Transcript_7669/g.25384  ORF Transcript_7669/g.25384 Transcript_7669/m.25384 type:complete len:1916 (-) Transcript_7669:136-5883(-)
MIKKRFALIAPNPAIPSLPCDVVVTETAIKVQKPTGALMMSFQGPSIKSWKSPSEGKFAFMAVRNNGTEVNITLQAQGPDAATSVAEVIGALEAQRAAQGGGGGAPAAADPAAGGRGRAPSRARAGSKPPPPPPQAGETIASSSARRASSASRRPSTRNAPPGLEQPKPGNPLLAAAEDEDAFGDLPGGMQPPSGGKGDGKGGRESIAVVRQSEASNFLREKKELLDKLKAMENDQASIDLIKVERVQFLERAEAAEALAAKLTEELGTKDDSIAEAQSARERAERALEQAQQQRDEIENRMVGELAAARHEIAQLQQDGNQAKSAAVEEQTELIAELRRDLLAAHSSEMHELRVAHAEELEQTAAAQAKELEALRADVLAAQEAAAGAAAAGQPAQAEIEELRRLLAEAEASSAPARRPSSAAAAGAEVQQLRQELAQAREEATTAQAEASDLEKRLKDVELELSLNAATAPVPVAHGHGESPGAAADSTELAAAFEELELTKSKLAREEAHSAELERKLKEADLELTLSAAASGNTSAAENTEELQQELEAIRTRLASEEKHSSDLERKLKEADLELTLAAATSGGDGGGGAAEDNAETDNLREQLRATTMKLESTEARCAELESERDYVAMGGGGGGGGGDAAELAAAQSKANAAEAKAARLEQALLEMEVPPPPPPPAPEVTDEELQALRAQAAEAVTLRAQAAEAETLRGQLQNALALASQLQAAQDAAAPAPAQQAALPEPESEFSAEEVQALISQLDKAVARTSELERALAEADEEQRENAGPSATSRALADAKEEARRMAGQVNQLERVVEETQRQSEYERQAQQARVQALEQKLQEAHAAAAGAGAEPDTARGDHYDEDSAEARNNVLKRQTERLQAELVQARAEAERVRETATTPRPARTPTEATAEEAAELREEVSRLRSLLAAAPVAAPGESEGRALRRQNERLQEELYAARAEARAAAAAEAEARSLEMEARKQVKMERAAGRAEAMLGSEPPSPAGSTLTTPVGTPIINRRRESVASMLTTQAGEIADLEERVRRAEEGEARAKEAAAAAEAAAERISESAERAGTDARASSETALEQVRKEQTSANALREEVNAGAVRLAAATQTVQALQRQTLELREALAIAEAAAVPSATVAASGQGDFADKALDLAAAERRLEAESRRRQDAEAEVEQIQKLLDATRATKAELSTRVALLEAREATLMTEKAATHENERRQDQADAVMDNLARNGILGRFGVGAVELIAIPGAPIASRAGPCILEVSKIAIKVLDPAVQASPISAASAGADELSEVPLFHVLGWSVGDQTLKVHLLDPVLPGAATRELCVEVARERSGAIVAALTRAVQAARDGDVPPSTPATEQPPQQEEELSEIGRLTQKLSSVHDRLQRRLFGANEKPSWESSPQPAAAEPAPAPAPPAVVTTTPRPPQPPSTEPAAALSAMVNTLQRELEVANGEKERLVSELKTAREQMEDRVRAEREAKVSEMESKLNSAAKQRAFERQVLEEAHAEDEKHYLEVESSLHQRFVAARKESEQMKELLTQAEERTAESAAELANRDKRLEESSVLVRKLEGTLASINAENQNLRKQLDRVVTATALREGQGRGPDGVVSLSFSGGAAASEPGGFSGSSSPFPDGVSEMHSKVVRLEDALAESRATLSALQERAQRKESELIHREEHAKAERDRLEKELAQTLGMLSEARTSAAAFEERASKSSEIMAAMQAREMFEMGSDVIHEERERREEALTSRVKELEAQKIELEARLLQAESTNALNRSSLKGALEEISMLSSETWTQREQIHAMKRVPPPPRPPLIPDMMAAATPDPMPSPAPPNPLPTRAPSPSAAVALATTPRAFAAPASTTTPRAGASAVSDVAPLTDDVSRESKRLINVIDGILSMVATPQPK